MNVKSMVELKNTALSNTMKFGSSFRSFFNNDITQPSDQPEQSTAEIEASSPKLPEPNQWAPMKLSGYQRKASMTIWQSFNSEYNDESKNSPQRGTENIQDDDMCEEHDARGGPSAGNCVSGCCGLHVGCCSSSYLCLFYCGNGLKNNSNTEKKKIQVVNLNSMCVGFSQQHIQT